MVDADESIPDIPQAQPFVAVMPQQVEIAVKPDDAGAPVARADAVEAVARVEQAVSATEVMVRAAEAVADAILVTPGLVNGEGEMLIRLKPDVLDGSEVRISVTGRELGVEFMPVRMETAAFIERNLPQLQQQLVARVHAYTIGVSVKRERNGRV